MKPTPDQLISCIHKAVSRRKKSGHLSILRCLCCENLLKQLNFNARPGQARCLPRTAGDFFKGDAGKPPASGDLRPKAAAGKNYYLSQILDSWGSNTSSTARISLPPYPASNSFLRGECFECRFKDFAPINGGYRCYGDLSRGAQAGI